MLENMEFCRWIFTLIPKLLLELQSARLVSKGKGQHMSLLSRLPDYFRAFQL